MVKQLIQYFWLINHLFSIDTFASENFLDFFPDSVQFSCSVVSDFLWPHGLQHARLPSPSPSPGACSNSCSLSGWCHPTVSSSVIPFSSCLQSFPASGSFPVSQPFASGGQSIGASASASVLPMNIQDWFPLGLTDLISLQSKGLSRVFSNTTVKSINSSALNLLYGPTLTSPAPGLICGMKYLWLYVGSNSPTRERTQATCVGSTES